MDAITAVFAFAIAFIFYGAGPLYLASERKKPIQKLYYWLFCILYDAVIFVALQLISGSNISLLGLSVTMLLFGTIFYFIGIAILRKNGMVAASPVQTTGSQPSTEPEVSVPTSEAPSVTQSSSLPPITETWYTCPNCGCLTPTGDVCACGYHPPAADTPTQVPVKRRCSSAAVVILTAALLCSVIYNAVQASEKANLSNDLSAAQDKISSCQNTIHDYKDAVSSAREHNRYLKEDLKNLCPGLSTSFSDTEFRHDIRNCGNPFIYSPNQEESVAYWMLMDIRRLSGNLNYK